MSATEVDILRDDNYELINDPNQKDITEEVFTGLADRTHFFDLDYAYNFLASVKDAINEGNKWDRKDLNPTPNSPNQEVINMAANAMRLAFQKSPVSFRQV